MRIRLWKYTVFSLTPPEPDSKQEVSEEGGPEMPPYYAHWDNQEIEIGWEEVSSDELTDN